MDTQRRCSVCGGDSFDRRPILWRALIDEWQISPFEADYIDRQQGECCTGCGANLRSIALANALRWTFGTNEPLSQFCASAAASTFNVLELNEAGTLHPFLSKLAGHVFGAYPQVDMHALPYPDGSFDVVIHSDTLEHVPNPIHALGECRRVLARGGTVCFTVPVIVGGYLGSAMASLRVIMATPPRRVTTTWFGPSSVLMHGHTPCKPAFRTFAYLASSIHRLLLWRRAQIQTETLVRQEAGENQPVNVRPR